MTDLVRRAQEGDQSAFQELYRQEVGRVYALCVRLTGDAAAAEERTQDAFIQAWRRLRSFRGDSAFSTWLYRLTVNVVLMERRATRRREHRVTPAANPETHEGSGQRWRPAAAGLGIDLERAIAMLPAGAREVFVLHDVEGYRHEDVAKMMGIAEGTSKAQLFRARRLLREMLER